MKKLILTAFLITNSIGFLRSQTEYIVQPRDYKVFASAEDYNDNKPMEGVEVFEFSAYNPTFKKNGKKAKAKDLALENYWFTLGGILIKHFDGTYYNVIYLGKLCYYCRWNDNRGREYYSEGSNGEMKDLSNSDFEELLNKYNLKKKFDADKSGNAQFKDNVAGAQERKMLKKAKYFDLISKQMQ